MYFTVLKGKALNIGQLTKENRLSCEIFVLRYRLSDCREHIRSLHTFHERTEALLLLSIICTCKGLARMWYPLALAATGAVQRLCWAFLEVCT